jgi:hypothetical protein
MILTENIKEIFGQKSDDHMPRTALFFFATERVNFMWKIIQNDM